MSPLAGGSLQISDAYPQLALGLLICRCFAGWVRVTPFLSLAFPAQKFPVLLMTHLPTFTALIGETNITISKSRLSLIQINKTVSTITNKPNDPPPPKLARQQKATPQHVMSPKNSSPCPLVSKRRVAARSAGSLCPYSRSFPGSLDRDGNAETPAGRQSADQ